MGLKERIVGVVCVRGGRLICGRPFCERRDVVVPIVFVVVLREESARSDYVTGVYPKGID